MSQSVQNATTDAARIPRGRAESVFVSGAGSGIGRAVALLLVSEGYHVFGAAINDAEAASLSEAFAPDTLTPIVLDVRSEKSVASAAKKVEKLLGDRNLKAVCNIAGVIVNGPLVDLSGDTFANVLAVNLVGAHNVTRALLPLMRPGGRVVNMSSASGVRTLPFTGAYSASKFGLEALTAAMRMEFAPLGIKATAVAPGLINTPMAAKIQEEARREPSLSVYVEPLKRFLAKSVKGAETGLPIGKVAQTVVNAITAEKVAPRYDIHQSFLQDAVLMRLMPIGLREAIVRRVLGLGG